MNVILAPILIPIFSAAILLLLYRNYEIQRLISGIVLHVLFVVSLLLMKQILVFQRMTVDLGDWQNGLGIVLYLDIFAALMIFLSSLITLVTWWFHRLGATIPEATRRYFYPLLLFICGGVNWAFLTGDLFNLFVSFELILICSYTLLVDPSRVSSVQEAYKFVIVNGVAGTLFLLSCGLIYGHYGTLNLAELSVRLASEDVSRGPLYGSLLLIAFGLKAAIFPLFTWLPTSYPGIPLGILPFLTGLLTKVGVYTIYRIYPLVFMESGAEWFQPLLLAIAALTMLVGVFAALGQWSMRDILSIHIVSQIGYMIFGVALLTPLGLTGGILSISHNIIVKTALFLIAGVVVLTYGTDRLKEVSGVIGRSPFLAILFLTAAISLAGLPPSSGFYSKWILTLEGLVTGHIWVTAAAVVTGLFTLASMVKIFLYIFWGEPEESASHNKNGKSPTIYVAAGLVTCAVLYVLLSPQITEISSKAAEQLLDVDSYRSAVLKGAYQTYAVTAEGDLN